MAIGPDDTIHLVGSIAGAAYFGGSGDTISAGKIDAYLARFDSDGGFIDAQRWGGAGTESALSVDVTAEGQTVIAGRFFSSGFDFSPLGSITGYGSSDGYVAKVAAP